MKNNYTIIIFGFSGSGKSTVANEIAKKYGLRVVHPSGILRNLYEGKPVDIQKTDYNRGFWESTRGIELFKNRLREKRPLDVVSDQILLEEIDKGNVVIDSWSLPWLTNKGVKIYLKAPLRERAKRVASRSGIPYKMARKTVQMKDEETRKLFKKLYGFDIKKDYHIFDLIVDTTKLEKKQVVKELSDFLSA